MRISNYIRHSKNDTRSDVATCCKAIFPRRPQQVQCQSAELHIAAAARRSKILSHISFPVATLALNSGAPQGGMMPNQYTGGGIATVFHTPKKDFHNLVGRKTRINFYYSNADFLLQVLTGWALGVLYIIM